MSYSLILIAHICGGVVGLVSGTGAMCFRKGSPRHVLAGKVFVASMLTMGAFATYLAITRHQPNKIGGGGFFVCFVRMGSASAPPKEWGKNQVYLVFCPHYPGD